MLKKAAMSFEDTPIIVNAHSILLDEEKEEKKLPKPKKLGSNISLSSRDFRGFAKVKDIKALYRWDKQLGAGQFGTVHEASARKINEKCALKVI